MSSQLSQASALASRRLGCVMSHVSNSASVNRQSEPDIKLLEPTVTHDPKALAQGSPFPPTTPGVLRLYNMRFCPFAQRTKLVLEHKKIPHETVNVNLKYKPDWFLKLSPIGLVPVLQLDDLVLPESTATCDWLDDTFPGQKRLTPSDRLRRAWDRVLLENVGKISDTFYALRRRAELKDKILDSLEKKLHWFENILSSRDGPYFGGTQPAMIDFMLWPHFERLPALTMLTSDPRITPEPQNLPRLAAWMKVMMSLPAVQATLMDTNAHAHFFASFGTGSPDYDFGLE
ncbi:glutathione S-transferase omega-1 [Elysia marginata]|uniref:Glutathione S-transferase omega n=1 Tax=Elysia marginata TaxID=1093978 RepID=A0AAV4JIH1_9GAST|nr:glutathione S-transferase omega-1 [Elysia marginata]